jgi:cytochrome c oxidase subunit 3
MFIIAWLIGRSVAGHFGPSYFTPVDMTGLYWHLVDLIWIYLFPILYLVG